MFTSQKILRDVLPWVLITAVVGACHPSEDDAAEVLAAPDEDLVDEQPAASGPRLADAEHGPVASVVHGDGSPGAASLAGVQDLAPRARPPRTAAEIAASHGNMLRETLARAPVRLELPADVRWTFEAAPGTRAGAYLVTSAEPLTACGADGPVEVRVPYHSELDLAVGEGRTLLVLGRVDSGGIESVLTTPWDGHTIVSSKSAAPVPLARNEVFGACPRG